MLRRLGFPDVSGNARFVVAIAIDAIGSGVFLPVSILYFLVSTPLSLTHIGLALSIASALQLPLAPMLGGLIDRIGPMRVLLFSNLLQALGFVGYVFAGSFLTVLLPAAVVQLGSTAFWGSYGPVVAMISTQRERERWFGFLGALRNGSFAIGGLAAAAVIMIGTDGAYTAVVVVNAASCLGAFALLLSVRPSSRGLIAAAVEAPAEAAMTASPWRRVLRDRAYLLFVGTNFTFAMSAMALIVAMPVYLTRVVGLPGWVAGAVFTINTLMIGLGQGLAVNAMGGAVRAHALAFSALLAASSYALLLGADWAPVAVGVVIALVGAVVYTGGELGSGPVLSTLSTDAAPLELRGRYVSLYQMSWTTAATVAPVSLTWLLSEGPVALWGALVAVALLGVVLSTELRRVMPLAQATIPRAIHADELALS